MCKRRAPRGFSINMSRQQTTLCRTSNLHKEGKRAKLDNAARIDLISLWNISYYRRSWASHSIILWLSFLLSFLIVNGFLVYPFTMCHYLAEIWSSLDSELSRSISGRDCRIHLWLGYACIIPIETAPAHTYTSISQSHASAYAFSVAVCSCPCAIH